MIKTIFADRDGTMGSSADVEFPETFRPFDFIPDCVKLLHEHGIRIYGLTNQSCIARGKDHGYDFGLEFENYGFDGLYLCPHDNADNCDCRKPKSGLLFRAREELGIDLSESVVIGDRESDLQAGFGAGCKTVLVRTGRKKTREDEESFRRYNLLFVADDFREAVERIVSEESEA